VSQLCLGGLIKHVAAVERNWANFIVDGAAARNTGDEVTADDWLAGFRMLPGETLAGLLAEYEEVARGPMSSWPRCLIWTSPSRCPRLPGSSAGHPGRRGGCYCT
jgi:Protein of unknown function (DUF664)